MIIFTWKMCYISFINIYQKLPWHCDNSSCLITSHQTLVIILMWENIFKITGPWETVTCFSVFLLEVKKRNCNCAKACLAYLFFKKGNRADFKNVRTVCQFLFMVRATEEGHLKLNSNERHARRIFNSASSSCALRSHVRKHQPPE